MSLFDLTRWNHIQFMRVGNILGGAMQQMCLNATLANFCSSHVKESLLLEITYKMKVCMQLIHNLQPCSIYARAKVLCDFETHSELGKKIEMLQLYDLNVDIHLTLRILVREVLPGKQKHNKDHVKLLCSLSCYILLKCN